MTQREVDQEIATYIREHPDEELRARNVARILMGKAATDRQIAIGFLHNGYSDTAVALCSKALERSLKANNQKPLYLCRYSGLFFGR